MFAFRLETCKQCGCGWEDHQHITYELKKFMNNFNLSNNNNNNTNSQNYNQAIEQRIKDLEAERNSIMKVCAKLTRFLQANSLNPVNDDILEYIQHFIQEEQTKKQNGARNESVIEGLKKLAKNYSEELKLMEQYMQNAQSTTQNDMSLQSKILKPSEIFLLVGELYHLPINGPKIRAQVDELKRVQQKFAHNREQLVQLPEESNSSSVMADLKNILT